MQENKPEKTEDEVEFKKTKIKYHLLERIGFYLIIIILLALLFLGIFFWAKSMMPKPVYPAPYPDKDGDIIVLLTQMILIK